MDRQYIIIPEENFNVNCTQINVSLGINVIFNIFFLFLNLSYEI